MTTLVEDWGEGGALLWEAANSISKAFPEVALHLFEQAKKKPDILTAHIVLCDALAGLSIGAQARLRALVLQTVVTVTLAQALPPALLTSGLEHHYALSKGTVLVGRGRRGRIRVEDMRGDFAHVHHVRRDGERDRRFPVGWSGCLPRDIWTIEGSPS